MSEEKNDREISTASDPGLRWPSADTWSHLANLVTVFSLLFAIAAAVFAWFEYRDRRNMALDAQTIEMIDAWEERGYRKDYARIRDVTRSFYDGVPEADSRAAQTDATARENLESRFYSRFFADDANVKAFEQIRYFFNRLHLCLQAGLCSQELAKTFFDDTVGTFLDCFGGYLTAEAAVAGRDDAFSRYRKWFSGPHKLCLERTPAT